MSRSPLSLLAGPLALVAGTLFVGAQVVLLLTFDAADRAATLGNPLVGAAQVGYFTGFCVLLLALVGAYQLQAERAGWIGMFAFAAAAIGTMFLGGDLWFDTFAGPWLVEHAPALANAPSGSLVAGALASYLLFAIGWASFGLASLRARVFPAPICVAIIVGGGLGFLALMAPFGVPLGLAIGSLGVWMIRDATKRPAAILNPLTREV